MSVFKIQGGQSLSGSVQVQGAKNSVLPILAATVLSTGVCVLHNCPRLTDVDHTLEIFWAEWDGRSSPIPEAVSWAPDPLTCTCLP